MDSVKHPFGFNIKDLVLNKEEFFKFWDMKYAEGF